MGWTMSHMISDIDDEQELPEDFETEGDNEVLLGREKDQQQKLMAKRRAIEDRLAQMQLERDTSDFDFGDLDD